ncbi:sigma-54 interaction domain-containing protein [Desulfocicer niacini]
MKQPDKFFHSLATADMDSINFTSLFEQMDDGVIIANSNGTVLFYNQAQSKIDNIDVNDALGKKITEIYELTNRTSMIMQCIKNKQAIKNKVFLYRSVSGKVANTISSVYPLISVGTLDKVICFVKDYEQLQQRTPSASECLSDMGNNTRYVFEDLVGTSPEFIRAKTFAQKASDSSSPVMLQGETGTGKELFAQSIHNQSPRRKGKFVAVNCGAIPHDLLEGMLFGTTKGAFTGAQERPGLFEQANNGTLFLDELLSMPAGLQVKLLRAIQEKTVRRLGSVQLVHIQVKIISSVSQDPRDAIQQGQLRADLFYRLGVIMIKLPPLRERRGCLPALIYYFIEKYNKRLGTCIKWVAEDLWDLIATYDWPGNIRELEHLIEGTMNVVSLEDTLGLEHVTPGMKPMERGDARPLVELAQPVCPNQPVTGSDDGGKTAFQDAGGAQSLTRLQDSQEKAAVVQALIRSGGNVTKAANELGISRQRLNYKMKKHGLFRFDYIHRPKS